MTIEYQLVKSVRRKTIALQVKQGKVFVRAPNFLSNEFIEQFVLSKQQWLKAKLDTYSLSDADNICRYKSGDTLFIRGEAKTLLIDFAQKSSVSVDDKNIIVIIPFRIKSNIKNDTELAGKVKVQLGHWFHKEIQCYVEQRLPELIEFTGLTPKTYKIRRYKARWGSCNNKGQLSFNSLLMMVPDWIIDYVIIHELCHLKYLNHSKQFWQLVNTFSPDYMAAKRWLKNYQHQLVWSE